MFYKTVLKNGMEILSQSMIHIGDVVELVQVDTEGRYNLFTIRDVDILFCGAMGLTENQLYKMKEVGEIDEIENENENKENISTTEEPVIKSETKAEAEFEKVIKEKFAVPDPNMYN